MKQYNPAIIPGLLKQSSFLRVSNIITWNWRASKIVISIFIIVVAKVLQGKIYAFYDDLTL